MQVSTSRLPRRQPDGTLELICDEAFILVKAAPRHSQTLGETVCCAGLDRSGNWVRLYPLSFRQLDDAQRFGRWDRIKYRWSKPKATKDVRSESRRVDHNSIEIVGQLKAAERDATLNRSLVTSLKREREAERSLALLGAEIIDFWHERHSSDELQRREKVLTHLRSQADLFATTAVPTRTCPYSFHYRYRDDDGIHEGTCQDWETERTFFRRLQDQESEVAALAWMGQTFGQDYPQRGMALAMGTHRYRADQWLINGIIRVNSTLQASLL